MQKQKEEEKEKLGFSQAQIFSFQMFTPTNNNFSNYFFPFSSSPSFPFLQQHNPSSLENINASSSTSSSSSAAANAATFYHHDHLSLPFIPNLIPELLTNNNNINLSAPSEFASVGVRQQIITPGDCNVVSGKNNFIAKKQQPSSTSTSKKDRHSKIYTSQGLRDRRVRLSIEIARKFFDLQDMLGFDKASNTLDWLFSKSKKAIQELELAAAAEAQRGNNKKKKSSSNNNNSNNKSFSSSSEEYEEEVVSDSGEKLVVRRPEMMERAKKESREKARARARERTNSHKGKSIIMEEHHGHGKEIEEYVVIKRKLVKEAACDFVMGDANHHHHHHQHPQNHQHHVIPNHNKEASFTNLIHTNTCHDYSMFPNLSTDWDINGRSNFCALANMNLSTGIIY